MHRLALLFGLALTTGCSPIVVESSEQAAGASGAGGAATEVGSGGTADPGVLGGSAGTIVLDSAGGTGGSLTIAPGTGGSASPVDIPEEGEAGAGGASVDLELGAGDLTMLVIFDKSGSMADGWDQRSKWQVANEAFLKAIDGVLDNLTIGAIFFPIPGDCMVEALDSGVQMDFKPGRTFKSVWEETAATRVPNGATPLELAMQTADLAIDQALELGLLEDRFRVVLVTDGEPTCNDDPARMVALAAEWHELGVETWVMGIPGSAGAATLLDSIAEAGGTEHHQSLGTPEALDDGLYQAAR